MSDLTDLTDPTDPTGLRQRATRLLRRILAASDVERAARLGALRPSPGDYARVFEDEAVAQVRAFYEGMWAQTPRWQVRPEQTELVVAVASVEDLRAGVGTASAFPGGYRRAARAMRTGRLVTAWEIRAPGAGLGMSYDGLVFLDPAGEAGDLDRWAWFPKPWRALPSDARTLSHWSD